MAEKKEIKHHDYGKKPAHKNLDELLKHTAETHYAGIDDALKDIDNFNSDTNREHVFANILIPGVDELYSAAKKSIEDTFKDKEGNVDNNASLYNKDKEVKSALVKGMLAYIKKVRPESYKVIEKTIDSKKPDEAYDFLAHHLDVHVLGLGDKALYRGLANAISKNKKATVNTFKVVLDQQKSPTSQRSWNYLVNKKFSVNLGKYDPFAVADHIKENVVKAEGSGYEIEDDKQFLMHDIGDLTKIYNLIKKGEAITDEQGKPAELSSYHIKKYEPKKKKPA